ncbi:Methionine aminopeptidase 1 [bioreactor metagenome]|uniref:Methionine aminopeptidase 1 n=1 Tax=bioreactor metagenome TaxID=1076179 RepID=A0A645ASC9_9ZZZZ|nr:type I methionyl aminopeptidase [Oscillospiraceae bacterium]
MIKLYNKTQIEKIRESCRITASALRYGGELVHPGAKLITIDKKIREYIESHGAVPSFLNYNGFPASACISVNGEIIHGIPDERILSEGDIVSIDVGAYYHGFHGDCADTFGAGVISADAKRLIDITKQCFYNGISAAKPDGKPGEPNEKRIGDISAAVQKTAEDAGFSVVREYVGHGVGQDLHESPDVPNYGRSGRGPRLMPGMVFAVEPMICQYSAAIKTLSNNWTVVTADGGLAAHYENTVTFTEDSIEILTVPD